MADTRLQAINTPIQESNMKGYLYKWTNYLKGYQKRWFVLSNGLLYYYRNPSEVTQSCRGTISLVSAMIHTEDSCNFVISNGGAQTFHLRAATEVDRQNWVTALELAKAKACRMMDSEEDEEYDISNDKKELQSVVKTLGSKLETLHSCHDVVIKHGAALQRSLIELEQLESPSHDSMNRSKTVNERATLFRITSSAMINACTEYLTLAQTHGKKWQKMLQHEHEARLHLEELVEQLAKQHSHLEQRAIKQAGNSNSNASKVNATNSDDDEFYDAEENTADFVVTFPGKAHRIKSNESLNKNINETKAPPRKNSLGSARVQDDEVSGSENSCEECEESAGVITRGKIKAEKPSHKDLALNSLGETSVSSSVTSSKANEDDSSNKSNSSSTPTTPITAERKNISFSNDSSSNSLVKVSERRVRRTKIPERPNHSLNLWSIMKNCIGKELTKIPMPVNFNEPLSMLQRLTENFEYAELLHKAAKIKDSCEQLTYLAAFTVSCYCTTSIRIGKPFNPLLGETFECDRSEDLGWKAINEQVSHHPPVCAQYTQGKGWVTWGEFAMSSKFRGKYLQVTPIDITHAEFAASGNHYTWKRVTTTVHNIIVGKIWVDNHGDMTITNHKTGDKCHLKFYPYSYFSRDMPRKVTGVVVDSENIPKWVLQGTWDNKMEVAKVVNDNYISKGNKPMIETATFKTIWKRNYPPPEYESMYNMTLLAVQLNEHEDNVAPTDSRLRPDQRLMEEGKWDEANQMKSFLEDKQRSVRRIREEESERAAQEGRPFMPYQPVWFEKDKDPITGNPVFIYNNKYWESKERQDWSRCPDIFGS